MKNCLICKIVGLLAAIGAINWGLVAFGHNLVSKLLGAGTQAERIVYIVVGVAGVMKLGSLFNLCPCTKGECKKS